MTVLIGVRTCVNIMIKYNQYNSDSILKNLRNHSLMFQLGVVLYL